LIKIRCWLWKKYLYNWKKCCIMFASVCSQQANDFVWNLKALSKLTKQLIELFQNLLYFWKKNVKKKVICIYFYFLMIFVLLRYIIYPGNIFKRSNRKTKRSTSFLKLNVGKVFQWKYRQQILFFFNEF
jgi:hypothetical protein